MAKVSDLLLVVLSLIFPSVQGAGVIQQFRRLRRFFSFRMHRSTVASRRKFRGGLTAPSLEPLEARTLLTGTMVPGLVHHWNFDEGPDWHDSPASAFSDAQGSDHDGRPVIPNIAQDSVGQEHATLVNFSANAWVSGQQFTALEFDGIDDYLQVAGNPGSDLTRSFSLSVWLRTTQTGAVDALRSPGLLGNDELLLGGLDDTGRLGVAAKNQWVTRTHVPVNDGRWHFITITRNSPLGVIQIFLDGEISAVGTGPRGTLNADIAAIGRRGTISGTDLFFAGRLDQISLFDRVLAPMEISNYQHNFGPKAWSITSEGLTGSSFATGSVLFNAFDPEADALRVVGFSQPRYVQVTSQLDGTFRCVPDPGYVGLDQFDVTIEDGHGGFSRVPVFLDILPTPDASASRFATQFTNFAAIEANGQPVGYASAWRVPRAVDFDRDGRTDLLVAAEGVVWLYRNIGTPQIPVFGAGVRLQAGGVEISTGSDVSSLTLTDLTGDSIPDLVVSDSANHLRIYRNTATALATPVYAAPVLLSAENNSPFDLSNSRFDLGDWNNDGLPDLIVGAFSGDVSVFLNTGTGSAPRMSTTGIEILEEPYNVFPRWIDISRNGVPDLIRGINWGDVHYWFDPVRHAGDLNRSESGQLTITAANGTSPALQTLTDGPVVDFADFNGDGVLDLVIGGQLAGNNVFLTFGRAKSMDGYLADLEAIYDAHPADLGLALEANSQQMLTEVRTALQGIVDLMKVASPSERQTMYSTFATHIRKYPWLRLIEVDLSLQHHVPSLIVQNILIAGNLLPDSPRHRRDVADLFQLSGLYRPLYLNFRFLVGDNVQASTGQLESLFTFLSYHPRESYPDTLLTIDQFWGDGRGALVEYFGDSKNTFSDETGSASDEWAADLREAILAVKPGNSTSGDIFTFVVGHEATHSLDAYVRSRENSDLERRWGQYLVLAAGADVIAGTDGFPDFAATRQHFFEAGYWDGDDASWNQAWTAYWSTGPGAAFGDRNILRGEAGGLNVQFFLDNPQESLATQGNQHWVDSEGRLIGAIDRFRQGFTPNLTEALTFLDFQSVGLNRVPMFDIEPSAATSRAVWNVSWADLRRDDRGYITEIIMADSGRRYRFTVTDKGVYTGAEGPITAATTLAISSANAMKAEGQSGSTPLTFTVIRSGSTSGQTSVQYQVTGSGVPTADSADFGGSWPSGTLTFFAGEFSKVITINVSGDSTPESHETFQVVLQSPSEDAFIDVANAPGKIVNDDSWLASPVVSGPIGHVNERTPTMTWTAISGATGYEIWVDNLTTGQSQVIYSTTVKSNSLESPVSLGFGVYRIWVRATGRNTLPSRWSVGRDFYVGPALLTPGPVTYETRPAFSWTALPGAASYQLFIQQGESVIVNETGITVNTFTPRSSLPAGDYRWWVRPSGVNGQKGWWSPEARVSLGGRTQLLTPAGKITDATPLFSWTQAPGATRYELWVNSVSTGATRVIHQTDLRQTSYSPVTPLLSGVYRVWIRAIQGSVAGAWSNGTNFVVASASLGLLDEVVEAKREVQRLGASA